VNNTCGSPAFQAVKRDAPHTHKLHMCPEMSPMSPRPWLSSVLTFHFLHRCGSLALRDVCAPPQNSTPDLESIWLPGPHTYTPICTCPQPMVIGTQTHTHINMHKLPFQCVNPLSWLSAFFLGETVLLEQFVIDVIILNEPRPFVPSVSVHYASDRNSVETRSPSLWSNNHGRLRTTTSKNNGRKVPLPQCTFKITHLKQITDESAYLLFT
jgi:hypothetical protein